MKQTGLRINDELLAWLLIQAKKEHRTLNNYITLLLIKEKEKQEGGKNV